MQYKTKAVRKAARWARCGLMASKYRNHKWFKELVSKYGNKHATRMARDAEGAPSFAPSKESGTASVVVWSQTQYNKDWMYNTCV